MYKYCPFHNSLNLIDNLKLPIKTQLFSLCECNHNTAFYYREQTGYFG